MAANLQADQHDEKHDDFTLTTLYVWVLNSGLLSRGNHERAEPCLQFIKLLQELDYDTIRQHSDDADIITWLFDHLKPPETRQDIATKLLKLERRSILHCISKTRRSVEHCTPHADGAWLNELGWSQ